MEHMRTEDKRRQPEPQWLLSITTDSRHAIAQRLGISHTTLNRQINDEGKLSADLIINVAHAYNGDVVRALLLAGKLTAGDVERYQGRGGAGGLEQFTRVALLQELLSREQIEGR